MGTSGRGQSPFLALDLWYLQDRANGVNDLRILLIPIAISISITHSRLTSVAISPPRPQHYKSNPWVAGYNPLNEPTDPKHTRLVEYYDRIEKAIRKVDDKHILFLE